MPLVDAAAENAALDACYGDGHAASWPDEFNVRLYDDDPRNGGVELDEVGGYTAAVVTNDDTNFPPASAGEKQSALIDFGTSSGAWSDVALWVGLEADGVVYEAVDIPDGIAVNGAGTEVKVQLSIFHEDIV